MTEGLFYISEHNEKCTCDESKKLIYCRDYTYYSYYARNVWGSAKGKYDDRKLLRITCNKCGSTWTDYQPTSKYWDVICDSPYKGEEKIAKGRIKLRHLVKLLLEGF